VADPQGLRATLIELLNNESVSAREIAAQFLSRRMSGKCQFLNRASFAGLAGASMKGSSMIRVRRGCGIVISLRGSADLCEP